LSQDRGYGWNPADYAANASAQRVWAREILGRLALAGDEHLLDVGSGDGGFTAELASAVPKGSVLGIDRSLEMVSHAQAAHPASRHPNLSFAVMDAREITVDRPRDAVVSNATLHWVEDHQAFLLGAARALRPGGRLVVSCGGKGNAADVFLAVRAVLRDPRWRRGFLGMPTPYHFYESEDYESWLDAAGFHPRSVAWTPREMVQESPESFAGWIRTTWLPYTSRVPANLREAFVQAIVDRYLGSHPRDAAGRVRVRMVRLEIVAEKHASFH
jgi:trans-aconitate methyltransferase